MFIVFRLFSAFLLGVALYCQANAQQSLTPAEGRLVTTERVQNAIDDVATVPLTYNFDQRVGSNHQGSTQYTKFSPYVPFRINSDYSFVVEPTVTYQSFNNFDGYSSAGLAPTTIQTYFTQSNQTHRTFSYGIGPMMQIRTNMPFMYGSSQNAVGYSLGAIHRSENWIVGFLGYQSFGLGPIQPDNLSATNVSLRPFITYITKRYGNITLGSESLINLTSGAHSYPINLTGSKIINVGDTPLLFTIGARYYSVNTMYGGAQGWGGRFAVTYAFSN
jgi:hypothetical protein